MTALGPWLWVVAGVNGAGKTTLAKAQLRDLPFINADERARELAPQAPEQAAITAGRLVFAELAAAFAQRRSAAWETTLSGRFHERVLRSARAAGFSVGAIYVGLDNPVLALRRIADRVAKGGHDVPTNDVERRYRRSLDHLGALVDGADVGLIFDNSTAVGHKLLIRTQAGIIQDRADSMPAWLTNAFGERPLEIGSRLAP